MQSDRRALLRPSAQKGTDIHSDFLRTLVSDATGGPIRIAADEVSYLFPSCLGRVHAYRMISSKSALSAMLKK
jgi:hypothetical protein